MTTPPGFDPNMPAIWCSIPRKPLSLIVAVSANGIIGAGGKIPWHIPEDFKFFKRTTLGHAVIMGRKTWESIGKPLPDRYNIIVTKAVAFTGSSQVHCCPSFESALRIARDFETNPAENNRATPDSSPFVIGGESVYREAMPLATRMYVTEVHREVDGDTRFEFDRVEWNETARVDGVECSWVTYERRVS